MRVLKILSGVLIAFALILGTTVWLLLQPGFAVDQAQAFFADRSGHRLAVGASHVTLLPEPAIVFEDVTLSEPGSDASPLVTAREVTLRTSLGAMISRDLSADALAIDGATVSLAIDGDGRANWNLDAGEPASLPPVTLKDATLGVLDQRSGLALRLDGFRGLVSMDGEGALSVEGDYGGASQPGTLAATVVSLKRLGDDGSPTSLTFAEKGYKFSFDGRLAVAKALDLAGQATFEWPGRFTVSGPFEARDKLAQFKLARFDAVPGSGTGNLAVDFSGKTPKLSVEIDIEKLDLAAFLPRRALDGSWSERPLGLARLKQVDVDAKAKVFDLRFGGLALGETELIVTNHAGRLQAMAPAIALYDGTANVGLTIDGARAVPEVTLSLEADKLKMPRGWGEVSSASVTLTSAGASQAELAGRLGGSGSLTLANAAWALPSLEAVLQNVSGSIVSDWSGAPSKPARVDAISASFTLADGIAATSDLRISTPGFEVNGTGEIDVLRRALDLKLEAARADGKPAFPVPLILQGAWSAPRLYPDMPGILDDPDAAYKALRKLELASETRQ
jgi:hypothetical protein